MKTHDFLKIVQEKVAVSAIGPSALRGQGKGVLSAAQKVLKSIHLSELPRSSRDDFVKWLDDQTALILDAMPIKNEPWGAARKAINLFLRDTLYNRYLCERFKIHEVEEWLEIPLDSAVAKGLKRKAGHGGLPVWPRLKHLRKGVSEIYQDYAAIIAKEHGVARVHLDIIYWLENR
jgi:hypothetical protein